jgi:hypothetical protein
MVIPFGKYKGSHLNKIVTDVAYTKWLLDKYWFKAKFPKEYEYLKCLFDSTVKQMGNTMYLYCLVLHHGNGVKVGKTINYVPKRIYDYVCSTNNYTRYIEEYSVDVRKSFVFKTNDLDLENHIKNTFKCLRIDGLSELFNIDFECINDEIHLKSKEDDSYFYYKKPLADFIPYDSLKELRKKFVIHTDKHFDFQKEYERHLYYKGFAYRYDPNFVGGSLN